MVQTVAVVSAIGVAKTWLIRNGDYFKVEFSLRLHYQQKNRSRAKTRNCGEKLPAKVSVLSFTSHVM